MPGLFGVIEPGWESSGTHPQELAEIVGRMSAAMKYEESYKETFASCPDLGAFAGNVFRSDESPRQELQSSTGATVLVTGEAAGQLRGRALFGGGVEIIGAIAGDCAAFISDPAAGKCFLCNDRYGRERIFLHRDGGRTFFSSEAKAILAVAPRTRAFDPVGLAELMACGCTLGRQSLYRGIEILEPGTVITFSRASEPSVRQQWTAEELETREQLDATQFIERFSEVLRTTVNSFVSASPAVGISLTGGLDSRMVMASLEVPPETVPCYTFGSMYRTTADVSTARLVAARCGQAHSVIELGQRFLNDFSDTLQKAVYISDGYLGFSGAAELFVNRQARSIAPARMTGNWGGELLRGVRAFKYQLPKGDFVGDQLKTQMSQSAAAFSRIDPHPLSAALFQQMPLQGYGRYAVERSQLQLRSPFLAYDVVDCLYRGRAAMQDSRAVAASVIGRRPELLAIPTDLGMLGAQPSVLRRASRRARVKAEYLTSHGAPDWLARLSAKLPAPVLETRFLGVDKFQHFRFWTRHDLAGWVRETLTARANGSLGNWFDTRQLGAAIEDHIAGRANYIDEIDMLTTLTLAEKTLFSGVEIPSKAGQAFVHSTRGVCP